MVFAFVIWSVVAVLFVLIGIKSGKSKTAAGFWANSAPAKVKDVSSFNKAVAKIWIIGAMVLELVGSSLLFAKQNSVIVIIPILGTVFTVIGMMVAYVSIEGKYRD